MILVVNTFVMGLFGIECAISELISLAGLCNRYIDEFFKFLFSINFLPFVSGELLKAKIKQINTQSIVSSFASWEIAR